MLNTLIVMVIVIAGAVLAYKSYRRRITGIADQNAVGHEEKAVDCRFRRNRPNELT